MRGGASPARDSMVQQGRWWQRGGRRQGIVPATHSARQWAKGLPNDQRNRAPPKRVWMKGRQGPSKETGFLARLSIGFPRPTTLPTTEKALGARGCRHSLLRRATRPCCCPSSLLQQGKAGVFIPQPQGCRGRPGAKCRRHGDPVKVEGVAVGWLLLIAGSSADHGEQRSRISGLGRREAMAAVICPVRVLSFFFESNAVDRSRSLPSSTGSVRRDCVAFAGVRCVARCRGHKNGRDLHAVRPVGLRWSLAGGSEEFGGRAREEDEVRRIAPVGRGPGVYIGMSSGYSSAVKIKFFPRRRWVGRYVQVG